MFVDPVGCRGGSWGARQRIHKVTTLVPNFKKNVAVVEDASIFVGVHGGKGKLQNSTESFYR